MKITIESVDGDVVEMEVDRDTVMDDLYKQFYDEGEWDDHTYLAALSEEIRRNRGSVDSVLQEFFDETDYNPLDYIVNEYTINTPKSVVRTPDGEYLIEECDIFESDQKVKPSGASKGL